MDKISQAELREIVFYDPETGVFSWTKNELWRAKRGQTAGSTKSYPYARICIKGKIYMAHRLAWFYTYGVWPSKHIDHINGIKTDNRIKNLRECTVKQNHQNIRKANKNNASGLLGVKFEPKSSIRPWTARIKKDGREYNLGAYKTKEEAHLAYVEAKRKLHEFGTI